MNKAMCKTNGGIVLKAIDYENCLQTEELELKIFGGEACSVIIDSDDVNEDNKESFFNAVDSFVGLGDDAFAELKELLFRAYLDAKSYGAEDVEDLPELVDADELIEELYLCEEVWLIKHPYEEKSVCVKLELDCPWDYNYEIFVIYRDGAKIDYFGTDSHFESGYKEMKAASQSEVYYNPYAEKTPREQPKLSAADQVLMDEQDKMLESAPLEINIGEIVLKRNVKGFEYRSAKIKCDVLFGNEAKIELGEYFIDDENQQDYLKAVENFIRADKQVMLDAQDKIYEYYKETIIAWGWSEGEYEKIDKAEDVWKHVNFASSAIFSRNDNDNLIYVSLECGCSWEEEHGLQIVLREGSIVNKVGQYDGHLD